MIESIELELEAMAGANLYHLMPTYLLNYFKDELNDNLTVSLINDLDSLIQTIETNNSLKILSLNDENKNQIKRNDDSSDGFLSQLLSLSDTVLSANRSLLIEIATRLCEIFTKYNDDLSNMINLFYKQQSKLENLSQFTRTNRKLNISFTKKQELLVYQRAILVQKLNTKHFDLFNLLFRNVFDFYHKSNEDFAESDILNEVETSGNLNLDDDNDNNDNQNESMENQVKTKNGNSDERNKDFNSNVLIKKFHQLNKILFDLEMFDHLCGNILVEVVQNKIRQYIESTSMDNYQESFIKSFEIWLEKIIIGWIKLIYSSSNQFSENVNILSSNSLSNFSFYETKPTSAIKFDEYLVNYKKQLAHFMYTHYANIRIKRLFDIVIDFPDSKNAIDDLKICLEKTNLRSYVIKSLKTSIEQRLLHPGVNTSDILTAYVSAIKALICLDSSGVMMENVCESLKKYLRNRDDTVKCIVSNLIDDGESSTDLMEEFCKDLGSYNSEDIFDSNTAAPLPLISNLNSEDNRRSKIKAWQLWKPDPIDAINSNNDGSSIGSKSNIISMLVNIYGSKDMFVNEYKTLLADRLLSSYSFNMEKEIRNLELLKLRFGDSNLFACEAMLKDISESKRINSNILEQLKQKGISNIESLEINSNNLKCIILSEQFWPKLKEEKIELPNELKQIQEKFMGSYEALKGNRTLIWKNNLGQVSIDIKINGQTLEFNVSPLQAAIIIKFQEKETWTLQELSQSLKMCSFVLRKKLAYWKMQGLIKLVEQNDSNIQPASYSNEQTDSNTTETYTLVKEAAKVSKNKAFVEDEEELEKSSQSNEILKEQEITLYWNYTQSMLRGCGVLPIDRIHTWLKLYANPDLTIEQVKYLLDLKIKEQLLKYNAGLYRLNK